MNGQHVQKPWLPENYGYVKNWDKVFRATKEWIITGKKPKESDIDDADPIWESDLLMCYAGFNYVRSLNEIDAD